MKKINIDSIGESFALLVLSIAIEIALVVLGLWLWKLLMVGIFSLPMISFWQFIGIRVLLKTFTGFKWSIGLIKNNNQEE